MEIRDLRIGEWGEEVTMRAPCQKFGHRLVEDFILELFDDQIVDGDKIGRVKSKFGKQQIDTVHAECELFTEFG